jgi:hypothetical protein
MIRAWNIVYLLPSSDYVAAGDGRASSGAIGHVEAGKTT